MRGGISGKGWSGYTGRACRSVGHVQFTKYPKSAGVGREKDLGYPRPQERPHKEFEPLELGLNDYEAEIRFRVHVARLRFHQINLLVPNRAFS